MRRLMILLIFLALLTAAAACGSQPVDYPEFIGPTGETWANDVSVQSICYQNEVYRTSGIIEDHELVGLEFVGKTGKVNNSEWPDEEFECSHLAEGLSVHKASWGAVLYIKGDTSSEWHEYVRFNPETQEYY